MDEQKTNEGGVGPIIATIIILAVIILGGFYFWSQRAAETTQPVDTQAAVAPLSNEAVQAVEKQSASDDTASIEADLKATNTAGVDAALTQ
ncbi:MAG: hypothetical protein WAV25_00100 [Minisyncoccia bacterium]